MANPRHIESSDRPAPERHGGAPSGADNSGIHVLTVAGWGYDAASLAPVCRWARNGGRVTCLDWTAALNPEQARAACLDRETTLVAGWSLGALCLLGLLTNTETRGRIAGAALTGATARFLEDANAGYAGAPASELRALKMGLRRDPVACLAGFMARCEGRGIEAARENAARAAVERWGAALLAEGLDALRDIDVRDRLDDVSASVALWHGAQDAIIPTAQARQLAARLHGASLVVSEEGRHRPDEAVLRRMGEWLMERARRSRLPEVV